MRQSAGIGSYIWSSQMAKQKREMEAATQGTGVVVTQTADNQLKLAVPSDVSFATGSAQLTPSLDSVLDRFAQTLNANPKTTVRIIGHTDSTGSDAINEPLSVNRAASVRNHLSEQRCGRQPHGHRRAQLARAGGQQRQRIRPRAEPARRHLRGRDTRRLIAGLS